MPTCPSCAGDIREQAALRCPYCGVLLEATETRLPATETASDLPEAGSTMARVDVEPGPLDGARFPPGRLFAARFRIVSLLGRGAMGEVYRAEDLKLGQAVALKLLSPRAARGAGSLARFASEVRLARDILHPNVCRVFDIGEADGWHYLSMEYVDGETLASVRHRIGRLPPEKALDVARQLCAGIGAAHAHGVLHRDLKPSNIMLDGRGRVRIMDFGLAMRAGDRVEEIAGTPAYMAPEQLAGAVATERTDLYALGLVLYEIFTGARVFETHTIAGRAGAPLNPRTLSCAVDVDPATAAIVRACLSVEPAARPPTAARVGASLPGGDTITAALAEGRVLPPDIVASAHAPGAMSLPLAVAVLASILVGVLMVATWGGRLTITPAELPKPPEALAERALQILAAVGHGTHSTDRAYWFDSPARRAEGRALGFAYRTSPEHLVPQNFFHFVTSSDPPMDVTGMATVHLDLHGRLRSLARIPISANPTNDAPPWPRLFAEAGLAIDDFDVTTGGRRPLVAHDTVLRWRPRQQRGSSIEVSAATLSGHGVYFDVADTAFHEVPRPGVLSRRQGRASEVILWMFTIVIFGATMAMVRRNLRAGEGDLQGARRLALLVISGGLLSATLFAHHVPNLIAELTLVLTLCGWMLLWGGFSWLSYVAFEPHVRRLWPRTLVSWTRVLEGRVRDPLVGRDVLVGVLAGVLVTGASALRVTIDNVTTTDALVAQGIDALRSVRHLWSRVIFYSLDGLQFALGGFFMLLFMRLLLRRTWLAAVVLTALNAPIVESGWTSAGVLQAVAATTLFFVVVLRIGLLAGVTMSMTGWLLTRIPLTLDFNAWYAGSSAMVLLVVVASAIWAFSEATRRRARQTSRRVEWHASWDPSSPA
jgi:hypothetical protein